MRYKYILFDLDGTLTDSYKGIASGIDYALQKFGITPLGDLRRFIGPPLKESFMTYCHFSDSQAVKAVDYFRDYYRERGIYENEVYRGIPELLEKLQHSGTVLALSTSKPRIFASSILEHHKLHKFFKIVVGSELDGTRSRKAEVIAHTLKKLGVSPGDRVIMVGDRGCDIEGALANHIPSIGVLYGYGSMKELNEAGASLLASDVEELFKILL